MRALSASARRSYPSAESARKSWGRACRARSPSSCVRVACTSPKPCRRLFARSSRTEWRTPRRCFETIAGPCGPSVARPRLPRGTCSPGCVPKSARPQRRSSRVEECCPKRRSRCARSGSNGGATSPQRSRSGSTPSSSATPSASDGSSMPVARCPIDQAFPARSAAPRGTF